MSDDKNSAGEKEGIRICMDNCANWDDLGWTSWIFVLLTFMVSMFLCLSTGYIRANQGNVRVIIVNGTRQYEELLNDDDISCLSDYEYQDTNATTYTPPNGKTSLQSADEDNNVIEEATSKQKLSYFIVGVLDAMQ